MRIAGISPDPVPTHQAFKEKHDLPFTLLADIEKEVLMQYGAWGEKTTFGRKYTGVLRTTYLVGADGTIRAVFENVKADGHSQEVLAFLDAR